jgi:hypothetical protein
MYNRSVYAIAFENSAFTNANGNYDFFEIDPAADKPVELLALFIGNVTEVGDAQEEEIRLTVNRWVGGTFTSSNGTSTTPRPLDENAGAASFAAEVVGSTVATSTGTLHLLHADTFNVRTGYSLIWPPEMRPQCSGAANSAITVRMESTLVDDASFSGTLYVAEL